MYYITFDNLLIFKSNGELKVIMQDTVNQSDEAIQE